MKLKVIDAFAGPGGLGEGFSSFKKGSTRPFKISLSFEKEESAHRTLLLRAFVRQFHPDKIPQEYYDFLKGNLGKNPEDELFKLPKFRKALENANSEALLHTLSPETRYQTEDLIREKLGNDEWILIGGPPCQAYSVIGRSRNYGDKKKKYDPKKDSRNFLYKEYLNLIAKFQPAAFIMENVKGVLSAKVDGKNIFTKMKTDLENPTKALNVKPDKGRSKHQYKIFSIVKEAEDNTKRTSLMPKDFIIKSENFGIPQKRHRVFLIGIRDDIATDSFKLGVLNPKENQISVRDVISDLPKLRSKLSKENDTELTWRNAILELKNKKSALVEKGLDNNEIVKNMNSYLRNKESFPKSIGRNLNQKKNTRRKIKPIEIQKWYQDEKLDNFITNHESRGHIRSDLHRYFYNSIFASAHFISPTGRNLPKALWPNHKNFASGKFADRFRVQVANKPSTTITSHISKDGHYYIHYDPYQCRSLTVREAARLQTFPDNYHFVGNRTQTYVQVGNAVPPLLAIQIADIIYSALK